MHLRLVVALAAALVATVAQARSGYLTTMKSVYAIAGTKLDSCATCHGDSKSARNSYGADWEAQWLGGASESQAFVAIEPLDSDRDGFTNKAEITALTFPGDATDKPTAVTYCADADNDGYALCVAGCTLASGDVCGDCNDNNAAVSPADAEICTDGIDNDCDGAIDAADPVCAPPPAGSDYDFASFAPPATAKLRVATTVYVTITNVSAGSGTLSVTGTLGRKTYALASGYALDFSGTQTLAFPWKPNAVGTVTWMATIGDGNADADEATASTVVSK